MSNDTFSLNRFLLLWKQQFIHNGQVLLFSTVAYVGAIFIVLAIGQAGDDFHPHDVDEFQTFMVTFFIIFGILYAGHSFPAFRGKESTIHYLLVPASSLEKFLFELINRVVAVIIVLPLLYWVTFHLQGYTFAFFSEQTFKPIGIENLVKVNVPEQFVFVLYVILTAGVMLGLILAFTGASMFGKQPLIKTLFALAVIVAFFLAYSYFMTKTFGLEEYHPPKEMILLPLNETGAFNMLAFSLIVSTVVMLVVAYRKLKEREV